MERIEKIEEVDALTLMDHYHRYQWAGSCAYGTVLDVACGIGYGSTIIGKNPNVKKYIGVDISADAIDKANSNYRSDICTFQVGSAYDLSFVENESIDTLITIETIEHLEQPDSAMKEFSRVLKKDGILLGSVPTCELDEHHEKYHGGNKYHVCRYNIQQIRSLIGRFFMSYSVYVSRMHLCIETQQLNDGCEQSDLVYFDNIDNIDSRDNLGNYLFVATKNILDIRSLSQALQAKNSIYLGPTYQGLYSQYIDTYNRYMETTGLYRELQQYYDELAEKYGKLCLEYEALSQARKR